MRNLAATTNAADVQGVMDEPVTAPALRVEGLSAEFQTRGGIARAVDGLSYEVHAGETLAIVGESGSGKSVSSLSLMGLIPNPPGQVVAGHAWFENRDLLAIPEGELRKLRGNQISMIFQDALSALNPVLSIRKQMIEGILEHTDISRAEAERRAQEMLERVQIPAPAARLREYPHQLSGGMLQRVMIAIALSCSPRVLIADEPTTALDVTIQAQILDLMRELRDELGTAIVLITHDMGVVAEMADRVVVMYAGRKVEEGPTADVFERPRHPYTEGLLAAQPLLGHAGPVGRDRLSEIPGIVPALTNLPDGCYFAERCRYAGARCHTQYPPLVEHEAGRWAACWESARVGKVEK